LRGQVAPGTESVPTHEGHSSAPCHVLEHHRKQWQHWWQATDSDMGYAAQVDQSLPDVPMPPTLTAEGSPNVLSPHIGP
jgi:hypothetical protein